MLTISSIFFFAVDPERHLADQPTFVRRVVNGIIWLGQRGVWLAAGVIFARLAASRASLLISQLDYFRGVLVASRPVAELGGVVAWIWVSLRAVMAK